MEPKNASSMASLLNTEFYFIRLYSLIFTCQNRQSPHSWERMIPWSIQNVQLIHISFDAVEFPVKVLYGRRVLLLKASVQKAGHYRRFPNFCGSENDHPVAVFRRDVKLILRRTHFLNHVFLRVWFWVGLVKNSWLFLSLQWLLLNLLTMESGYLNALALLLPCASPLSDWCVSLCGSVLSGAANTRDIYWEEKYFHVAYQVTYFKKQYVI